MEQGVIIRFKTVLETAHHQAHRKFGKEEKRALLVLLAKGAPWQPSYNLGIREKKTCSVEIKVERKHQRGELNLQPFNYKSDPHPQPGTPKLSNTGSKV